MQSFEIIRTRLLSQAAGRFHCKPEALQPEIRLLADWMAWELNALSRQLDASNDAIRRRLERQLQPDTCTRPFPAHALAYAHPKKDIYTLRPDEDVFLANRHAPEPPHQVFFSPLKASTLLNVSVKYLAAGQQLQEIEAPLRKQPRLLAQSGAALHPGILWIGVQIEKPLPATQDLCFYIDWNIDSDQRRGELLQLLTMTQWHCNGQPLGVRPGFDCAVKSRHNSGFLDDEYLHLYALEQRILQQYESRFITISTENQWHTSPVPADLQNRFDAESLANLSKNSDLLWLSVSFPSGFSAEELGQTVLQLNCFPVLNRRIENRDIAPAAGTGIEIVPLSNAAYGRAALHDTGCHFLGLQRVFTQKHEYRPVVFDNFRAASPGTYALQHGRVEADDLRDLYARVGELAHLLQTEASKLGLMSPHIVSQTLADIERGAAGLESALRTVPPKDLDPGYYLQLRILDPQDYLYIRFWLTQGDYARDIAAPGDLLMAEKTGVFVGEGAVVVAA